MVVKGDFCRFLLVPRGVRLKHPEIQGKLLFYDSLCAETVVESGRLDLVVHTASPCGDVVYIGTKQGGGTTSPRSFSS